MKNNTKDIELIDSLRDYILNSRLSVPEICDKLYITRIVFDRLMSNIESTYGVQERDILKEKIKLNSFERVSIPKNMYSIKEKQHVALVKSDIRYLDYYDYRRLCIVSDYLFSDCDVENTMTKYDIAINFLLQTIGTEKNANILKPQFYALLQKYYNVEKSLYGEDLMDKKNIITEMYNKAKENSFDINKLSNNLRIPVCMLKRILDINFIAIFLSKEDSIKIAESFEKLEENKNKAL